MSKKVFIGFSLVLSLTLGVLSAHSETLKLKLSEDVLEVKTFRYSADGYESVRLISELQDIYPSVTVEVFMRGGEGDPTEILASKTWFSLDGESTADSGMPYNSQGPVSGLNWSAETKTLSFTTSSGVTCSVQILEPSKIGTQVECIEPR